MAVEDTLHLILMTKGVSDLFQIFVSNFQVEDPELIKKLFAFSSSVTSSKFKDTF